VVIADQGLSNPATVFEATGLNFADALGAGPAAGKAHAAILLTNGATQAAATAAYLTAHPADTRYALGGPAAAADPSATALVGATRFETSTLVAGKFFVSPAVVGIASGADYPDALAGGPQLGVLGGPLVLVAPDTLPPVVDTYLRANSTSIASAIVFGGPAAIADVVVAEVESAINNA
jgi:hypothetical protein